LVGPGTFPKQLVTFYPDLRLTWEWARWIPLVKRSHNPPSDPQHTQYILQGCGCGRESHTGRLVWTIGSHPLGARILCRPPIGLRVGAQDSSRDTDAKRMVIYVAHYLGGCGWGLGVWGCTGAFHHLFKPVSRSWIELHSHPLKPYIGDDVAELPTKSRLRKVYFGLVGPPRDFSKKNVGLEKINLSPPPPTAPILM
jgi:hypothetical protein